MLRVKFLKRLECCNRRFFIFGAEKHLIEIDFFVQFGTRRRICLIGSGHLSDVERIIRKFLLRCRTLDVITLLLEFTLSREKSLLCYRARVIKSFQTLLFE